MKTIELDGILWELPYHDLLPPLPGPLFDELKEDIRDKGGNIYPVLWAPSRTISGTPRRVIDGGHRLRAVAELREAGNIVVYLNAECLSLESEEEERQAAIDLNIKRRHLTPEQRAEWVAKLRQEGKSTRQIAEDLRLSQSAVVRELKKATESGDSVDLPSTIVGKDGKEREAHKPRLTISTPEERADKSGPSLYDAAEARRPAASPAGSHAVPAALPGESAPSVPTPIVIKKKGLTDEERAQIAESVEASFARSGPLHPVTLLPSEPPATNAPREAADDDGAHEVGAEYDDEASDLRAEVERLKEELARATKKKAPAIAASDREDHNTPPEILEVVRDFAGGQIALDPCSNSNSMVDAALSLTKEDDGLSADWYRLVTHLDEGIWCDLDNPATVFVNPPYDQEALAKTNEQAGAYAGNVLSVITLVPVKSDQEWFQLAIESDAQAVCFVSGRVRFYADGVRQQGAAFESCLFYYGICAQRFCEVFALLGVCLDLTKNRGQA